MGLTADIAQNHSRHLCQPPHRHPSAGARAEEEKSCRRLVGARPSDSAVWRQETVRSVSLALRWRAMMCGDLLLERPAPGLSSGGRGWHALSCRETRLHSRGSRGLRRTSCRVRRRGGSSPSLVIHFQILFSWLDSSTCMASPSLNGCMYVISQWNRTMEHLNSRSGPVSETSTPCLPVLQCEQ